MLANFSHQEKYKQGEVGRHIWNQILAFSFQNLENVIKQSVLYGKGYLLKMIQIKSASFSFLAQFDNSIDVDQSLFKCEFSGWCAKHWSIEILMPTLVASAASWCQPNCPTLILSSIKSSLLQGCQVKGGWHGMAFVHRFQVKCCTFKELNHPRLERKNKHFLRSQFLQIIWNGF